MILGSEQDLFPADLFEADGFPVDGRAWWLVHTKPRGEKSFARRMASSRLPFFLPCRMTRKKVRGRVQTSWLPIFSGYAFVRVDDEERPQVFFGDHVAKLVAVVDQERLWRDLRQVRKFLDLGVPVAVEDRLIPGQRVRLRSGPLAGMCGTVVREAGTTKFVVEVDLIHKGISVTVDKETLGLLDAAEPIGGGRTSMKPSLHP